MPVVPVPLDELNRLAGLRLGLEEALELLPQLGGDLDRVEGETAHVEYFPDRSDLVSVEGVARALAAFTGNRPGLRRYETGAPVAELTVETLVATVRPWILACGVTGLPPLDDDRLVALMEFQERLANGIGRRRRRVAIGIHDAGAIRAPYRYTVARKDTRFHPLQGDREMSVEEILEEHPKGRAWRHLLPPDGPYPIILDADGHVLSLPPVINGTRTELREGTTELVLDLTGPDLNTLHTAMAILATALLDQGGRLQRFAIRYPKSDPYRGVAGDGIAAPDLSPRAGRVRVSETKRVLGLDLPADAVAERLRRLGHDAAAGDGAVEVLSPRWRGDLLHEWDLIEDVAKGHGYAEVPDALPQVPTTGTAHPTAVRARLVRAVLTGLGFLEATTLTLSSLEEQYDRFDLARPSGQEAPVTVANPITTQHTVLRSWLLPSLFGLLGQNRHRDYPQSLYEAGIVVDPARGHQNAWRLAAVRAHAKANYSEGKAIAEAILRDLAVRAQPEPDDHPAFIPGRVARLVDAQGVAVGRTGEIHPRVLQRYELAVPVVALEFDLERLFG